MKTIVSVKLTKGHVDAELISQTKTTSIVRLPDGNVIKRHNVKHEVTAK